MSDLAARLRELTISRTNDVSLHRVVIPVVDTAGEPIPDGTGNSIIRIRSVQTGRTFGEWHGKIIGSTVYLPVDDDLLARRDDLHVEAYIAVASDPPIQIIKNARLVLPELP